MKRAEVCELIRQIGVIPAGRVSSPEDAENREVARIKEFANRFVGFVRDARQRPEPPKEGKATKIDSWKLHKRAQTP